MALSSRNVEGASVCTSAVDKECCDKECSPIMGDLPGNGNQMPHHLQDKPLHGSEAPPDVQNNEVVNCSRSEATIAG